MKKLILLVSCIATFSCKENKTASDNPKKQDDTVQTATTVTKAGPEFNAQNAYNNIKAQVDFGPRVPGTPEHKKTAEWLEAQLKLSADSVIVQSTTITLADGKTKVPCYNIIGSFNPQAKRRVLFLAHWDTRPWADHDFRDREKPIPGADDGGSGTGVLLELARAIRSQPLSAEVGVDILLVDVEDYAKSEWGNNAFAQGSQYWSRNPHVKGYTAEAGILLDMVGAANARFAIEGNSQRYAKEVVSKVWGAAEGLGYGKYFVYEAGAEIADDHVPVNEILGIPTIDIINLPSGSSTGFVGHWHTHDDDMSKIDVNTLKAVGQTLVQYLYSL